MDRRVEEVGDGPTSINFCGECGYSLVALPEQGRCPECGAAYDVSTEVVVFGRPGRRWRIRDFLFPTKDVWPWFARGSGWRLLGCWVLSLVAYVVVFRNWPHGSAPLAIVLVNITFQIPAWFRVKFPADPRAAATVGRPSMQVRVSRRGVGTRRGPGPVGWQSWDRGDGIGLEKIGDGVYRLRVSRGRRTQLVGGDPADVVIECEATAADMLRERIEAFQPSALNAVVGSGDSEHIA